MALQKMFNPKTIAVVGASSRKGSVGCALFSNIRNSSFSGTVFPVNIKRRRVQGVKAYPSISHIKRKVDLAIIATPAASVPPIIEECGRLKIRNAVVISAGFIEAGEPGRLLFGKLADLARVHKINLLGPNCLGFINPGIGLNASFARQEARPGQIAFISQSGALCTAMLDWARENRVGFSHFVSIGSMAGLGFAEILEYLGRDSKTKAVIMYIESVKDGESFISAARKAAVKKPVIALKVGRFDLGAKAARSHTGSMAGNDLAYGTAFKKAGIIRIENSKELFDCAKILSLEKSIKGSSLAIVTNAGGPGVLAADACEQYGVKLPGLSRDLVKAFDKVLPASWSRNNPIDILGDATPERYGKALALCQKDKDINGILAIVTPQAMTEPVKIAHYIAGIKTRKVVMVCLMGGTGMKPAESILEKRNIPVFLDPESAVKAFYSVSEHLRIKQSSPYPFKCSPAKSSQKEKAGRLIDSIRFDKIKIPSEEEVKRLLSYYGFKSLKPAILKTKDDASGLFKGRGERYVFKVLARNLLHKTDINGVRLDIKDPAQARRAFWAMDKKFSASLKGYQGIMAEKQLDPGLELLLGLKRDKKFGPLLVFGRGGVEVEVYKDIAAALAPVNLSEAYDLIKKTKVSSILDGYRGGRRYNLKRLAMLVHDFSRLVCDFPEISELDINPLVPYGDDFIALDAKAVIDP